MDHKKNKRDDPTFDAIKTVSSSITNFIEKSAEKSDTKQLPHTATWLQLEKLFEQLDDEKITDLSVAFILQT